MISKHTFYSIFIPSLFFLIFHLVHPLLNLKDIEYKCVYVNPSLCIAVEKNKDSVKTIDLDDYEIKLDNLKVNQEVIYDVKTVEERRRVDYIVMLLICFLLALFIRFPQVFGIIGNIDL